MSRRILSLIATGSSIASLAALPTAASASQSGLTGIPWVDQYIEQVPTAGGGKAVRDVTGSRRTALTRSEVAALADAGGDRLAAAVAASVLPLAGSNDGPGGKGGSGSSSAKSTASLRRQAEAVAIPSASATLIDSASGGNGGLGPVLPAALIGSMIGAIALAASRIGRIGS